MFSKKLFQQRPITVAVFIFSYTSLANATKQDFHCKTIVEYRALNESGQTEIKTAPMTVNGTRDTVSSTVVGQVDVIVGSHWTSYRRVSGSASNMGIDISAHNNKGEGFRIVTSFGWATFYYIDANGFNAEASNEVINNPNDRHELKCHYTPLFF